MTVKMQMKKETFRLLVNPGAENRLVDRQDDTYYRNLINEYFQFIEIQCRKAVEKRWGHGIAVENEALELSNKVLDKLQEDHYKVLKQFKGKARLSTYITAIISNQAVESIRKKRGRSREKERAKKFGTLGEQIYEMVFVQGAAVPAAYTELKSRFGFSGSLEEVEAVAEKIKGKGRAGDSMQVLETGQVMTADNHHNPEDLFIENQRQEKLKEIVNTVVSQLKGEERLILRMRFPTRVEEEPREIDQISRLLGISNKAVYNRISRVLKKCRHMLVQSGINIHDLF